MYRLKNFLRTKTCREDETKCEHDLNLSEKSWEFWWFEVLRRGGVAGFVELYFDCREDQRKLKKIIYVWKPFFVIFGLSAKSFGLLQENPVLKEPRRFIKSLYSCRENFLEEINFLWKEKFYIHFMKNLRHFAKIKPEPEQKTPVRLLKQSNIVPGNFFRRWIFVKWKT